MIKLFCGIDLGTRSSALCIVDETKKVIHRWGGSNAKLSEELGKWTSKAAVRCVVEAGPLAESICLKVESVGATIEIVDSRHTKALLHGKKKTDRIDAQVLAELCLMGWYKPVFRKSGEAREARVLIAGRVRLVEVCTELKNSIRGLLKSLGIVLPAGCEGERFVDAVEEAVEKVSEDIQRTILDLLEVWREAHRRQKLSYKKLGQIAVKDATSKRSMTVPGIGPATALAFTATIATHNRFQNGAQVAAYVGLAPTVHQSGDTEFHGRITKKGDRLLRWLLVEAAGVIMTRVKQSFPLREWALRLATRKGAAKAKVALARRLAVLLFTLWKTETDFRIPAAA
jgi:transposase